MGDISSNFNVQKEIEYRQFLAELQEQKTNVKNEQEARSIFNRYDENHDGTLNEDEQVKARKEYLEMDTNDNEKLSKKEFNKDKKAEGRNVGSNYDAYKVFNQVIDNITAKAKKTVVERDDDEVVTVEGHDTKKVEDDKVDGKETIPPTPQPITNKPAFEDNDAATLAVYQYLLGESFDSKDLEKLKDNERFKIDGLEIGEVKKGGADEVEVKYNKETYILRKSGDNISINKKQDDGAKDPVETLQHAILEAGSTDTKHAYRNRHGSAGNSQSTYDSETGRITNTSTNRRHVNPAQTFAKMLMNNDEGSTLTIDKPFSGQDVISVIKGDDAEGITLHELMMYLSATLLEESDTDKENKSYGVRNPAKDADMDVKDMANIGIVFKKYAKNGMLDASGLDNLINELKNKSMTQIAKDATNVHHSAEEVSTTPTQPTQPTPPTNNTDRIQDPSGENVSANAKANKTRKLANNGEEVNYVHKNGTRTVVEDGRSDSKGNIAVFQDHGLFGWGKKDFIYIEGLEQEVDAQVVDRKKHTATNVDTIKIKKRGDKKVSEYYEVTYDSNTGRYKLGANKIMVELFGNNDKDKYQTIPKGLTLEYKKGKAVYKLNGNQISEERARAHVIAANKPKET